MQTVLFPNSSGNELKITFDVLIMRKKVTSEYPRGSGNGDCLVVCLASISLTFCALHCWTNVVCTPPKTVDVSYGKSLLQYAKIS